MKIKYHANFTKAERGEIKKFVNNILNFDSLAEGDSKCEEWCRNRHYFLTVESYEKINAFK